MTKKKNPRQIVNAGELIGRALSTRELVAVASAVLAAQRTVSSEGDYGRSLSLAMAKLRKAYDYKGLKAAITVGTG